MWSEPKHFKAFLQTVLQISMWIEGQAELGGGRMKSKEGPLPELEELEKCEQEKASILNSLSEEITHLDMEMRITWSSTCG